MIKEELEIFEHIAYELKQINESIREMNYYNKKSNDELINKLDEIKRNIENR